MTATVAATQAVPAFNNRLEGEALLAKLRSMDGATRAEAARACGYLSLTEDGKERILISSFNRAIADATAPVTFSSKGAVGTRGPGYQVKVGPGNAAVVGAAYLRQIGAEPGDYLKIEVDPADKSVVLFPATEA